MNFVKELSPTECHKNTCKSLGINNISYDTVTVQFWKFKPGNIDTEDEPRSRRPIEVDCEQLTIIDRDRCFKMNYCVRVEGLPEKQQLTL